MSAPARNAKVLVPLKVITSKLLVRHSSTALRCTAPAIWYDQLEKSQLLREFTYGYQRQDWFCRCLFFPVAMLVWIQNLFWDGDDADTSGETENLDDDIADANVYVVVSRGRPYSNRACLNGGHCTVVL